MAFEALLQEYEARRTKALAVVKRNTQSAALKASGMHASVSTI